MSKDLKDTKDMNQDNFVELANDVVQHLAVVTVSSHLQSEPSTPSLASEIIEQHTEIGGLTAEPAIKNDPALDDVLGKTTHKSDGRQVFQLFI